MKLFIKLIFFAIYYNKYINWQKVNQAFAFTLAETIMFHPEDKPYNKLLNTNELKILLEDI